MLNSLWEFLGFTLIIFLLAFYLPYRKKQTNINEWKKSLHLKGHAQIFQQLFQNSNGFVISQQARKKYDALDYIYGEIEFISFLALLSLAKPDSKTIFYDLGCGIGKAVLACAMVYPVCRSIGVEILPELYFDACKQKAHLAALKTHTKQTKKIKFILGDFLEVNLDDATLIFINSTAIFNPTWEKLCTRIDLLPHVTTVITTSKSLSCKNFTVIKRTKVEMSWGIVLAYIHVRKKNYTNTIENIE